MSWEIILMVFITLFVNLNVVVGGSVWMTCPSGCICRFNFQLVQCDDRFSVPSGSFSWKVKQLDLRSAHITVIKKGSITKKYPKLKRLYLAGNPFDCSRKNLRSTQKELFQLLKREKLSRFDGRSLRCATPRQLKFKRMLFLVSTRRTTGEKIRYNLFKNVHSTSVVVAVVSISFAFLLILVALGLLYHYKDRVFKFILERTIEEQDKREGSKEGQTILNHSLGKDAKPFQQVKYVQFPMMEKPAFLHELDWIASNQQGQAVGNVAIKNPAGDYALYMKEKMSAVRSKSKGYPEGDASSDEEVWADINLKSD